MRAVAAWAWGETTRDIVQAKLFGPVEGSGARKRFAGTGLVPGEAIGGCAWRGAFPDLADTVATQHASGGFSTLGLKSYQRGVGGYPIEGAGHPLGSLDWHVEIAALAAAEHLGPIAIPFTRQVYRAGRQVLEKIRRNDEAPAGKDIATAEGPNPTGAGVAKAAEIALSISRAVEAPEVGIGPVQQEPTFEVLKRGGEQTSIPMVDDGAQPNPDERRAGEAFAELGYDVRFKRPVADFSIPDVKTADLLVDGIGTVEIYSPDERTSLGSVATKVAKKSRQALIILVQGNFSVGDMKSIAARVWGKPNGKKIESLLFQSPGHPILKFDRMSKTRN